jgi:hypothetical protein
MPQLLLALEGRVDFLKKTNPFGGGEDKPKQEFTIAQQRKINEQRSRFALMKIDAANAHKVKKNG